MINMRLERTIKNLMSFTCGVACHYNSLSGKMTKTRLSEDNVPQTRSTYCCIVITQSDNTFCLCRDLPTLLINGGRPAWPLKKAGFYINSGGTHIRF